MTDSKDPCSSKGIKEIVKLLINFICFLKNIYLIASDNLGIATNRWTHSGVTPIDDTHIEVNPNETIQNEDRMVGSVSKL